MCCIKILSVGSVVLKNIKTTPKDKLYTLLPKLCEDEEQ